MEVATVTLTFEPLFELWTTVLLLAPPAALLIWQLFRTWRPAKGVKPGTWRNRWNPLRRLLVVAFLGLAAAGPAVPGAMTKVVVSDIDVFLVIDTTTSSNAEDAGPSGADEPTTRLDAIKEDAFRVATEYGGARYSVITFDNGSLVRLPLVADPTALQTTLDTLEVELSSYAGGSSISEPLETLLKRLKGSQADHPERLRLVFYFGDGEQTRDDPPESMAAVAPYIGDGAVFGYGTEAGGPMRPNLDFGVQLDPDAPDAGPAPYLLDTTLPGSPTAISRIDEDALKAIASQLGVGYQHRTPGSEASFPDVEDRMGEEIEVPEVAVAERLYWIPVLAAFALILWDLVIAGRNLGDLRAARPPRTKRSPAEPRAPRAVR
ncbi:MAG: VWA domain-containing protein [Pseudolysinimonas sp.]